MDFSAVGGCAVAGGGGVHDVSRYIEDDTEGWVAGFEEADADGEVAQTGDEIVGAVDGVDDPVSAGRFGDVECDRVAGFPSPESWLRGLERYPVY